MRHRIAMLAMAVVAFLGAGAAAAAGPPAAGAAIHPKAPATSLVLSPGSQRHLLGLYAEYRHIAVSDIARIVPGSVRGAQVPGSGAEWAVMSFLPSSSPALAIRFQDGAGSGIFTRPPGADWKMVGLGGEPVGCGDHMPVSVRRSGTWPGCRAPAVSSRARRIRGAVPMSDTDQVANIATDQVGVSDNPAEHNFNGLDCNPFTAMEVPGASTAGCGRNSKFNVTDASEEWCADFTKWVWAQAGVTSDLGVLTPSAASFYTWGQDHGESMPVGSTDPQVGDAVVFFPPGGPNGTFANHVGIVTGVNPNGTVNLVDGDFLDPTNISVLENDNVNLTEFADDNWNNGAKGEEWVFVSPQLSTANTSPAAGVDGSGKEYVFWENTGGGLEETYYNGSSWVKAAQVPGMGPLGSSPTVAVAPGGNQYVFWEGTGPGHDLYEAYYNGSAWNGPIDLGDGPLGSAPTAGVDSSGKEYVFWENTNGGLEETYYNGSSWVKAAQVPGMGPLGSSPTVAVAPGGNQYVFWQGTGSSADLYEAYYNGNGWNGPIYLGDGPLGSAPTAGVDSSGKEYVFWENTNGGLEETYYNGSSWVKAAQVPGMGPLGSAPTVAVAPGGNQYVFWQGTGSSADLYEAYYNGSAWNGPTDLGDGPLG